MITAMRSGTSLTRVTRLGSLLAIAAFGVHQVRYLLAFGGNSSERLSHHGHDYLAGALPYLAALALAAALATVLGARFGPGLAAASRPRRAIPYAVAILAVYACQELLEGALAPGHPAGLPALLAGAGWVAVPLALVFGAVTALAVRGLEGIEAVLAPAPAAKGRPLPPRSHGAAKAEHRPNPLRSPLAFGLARRPPPAALPAN